MTSDHDISAFVQATAQQSGDTISDYEESVWFQQQQNPDRVFNHVSAWKFDISIDPELLVRAVQDMLTREPAFASLYRFDDAGELHKYRVGRGYSFVDRLTVQSDHDCVAKILARQRNAIDLETTPAISAQIITTPDAVILSLIVHQILSETYSATTAIENTLRSLDKTVPHPFRKKHYPADFAYELDAVLLPDLQSSHRSAPVVAMGGIDGGQRRPLPPGFTLNVDAHPNDVTAAKFIMFMLAFSGRTEITAWLTLRNGAQSLHVTHDMTIDALLDNVRAAMRLDQSGAVCEYADQSGGNSPAVYITLGDNDDCRPAIDGAVITELVLPTYEDMPEISLRITPVKGGGSAVTLTTGRALYDFAGEYVLNRFDHYLATDECAVPSVRNDDDLTAKILAEFRAVLGEPDMKSSDDFFDFGGHSMLATRVIGRLLKEYGVEIRFNDFFKHATASELAAVATSTVIAETAPPQVHYQNDPVPLCAAQISMWRGCELFDFGAVFNLPFALDFLDPVDEGAFARAFRDVVERHAGLRSHFYREGETAYQKVVPVSRLDDYKWFWSSDDSREVTLHDEVSHVFDLQIELPFRIRFIRNAETGRQNLSFVFHHLAIDEWSLNILMDDLAIAYRARIHGDASIWAQPAPRVSDYAKAQATHGVSQAHIDHWKTMLSDATHGLDIPHPTEAADENAVGWLECPIDQRVADKLYKVARSSGASLFNVIYAMIALSLHKAAGQSDIVIGTSADGRTDPKYFDAIGYFTTMVAHRVTFDESMSMHALIEHCRDVVLSSTPYTDVPIDLIEESLGIVPGRDRFFDAYVQIHAQNKLNGHLFDLSGNPIRYQQIPPEKDEAMLGIQFEIMEYSEGGNRNISIYVTYRTDRFSLSQVQNICGNLEELLIDVVKPDGLTRTI